MVLLSPAAFAQRDATTQAFERMEEALLPEVEEGSLNPSGIGPILLVGATPAFEETRAWFPVAALESMIAIFGRGNVRVCEACMNPRLRIKQGRMEHNSVLSLPEISELDRELRGNGAPARSAVWLEETPGGIAMRLIALGSGQVLFAGNFDSVMSARRRTASNYNATLELGRRLRGDSLTHIFIDMALIPNQHVSIDICEQFGSSNKNLAGLSISAQDPFAGIGAVYYRVIPAAWNLTVGAQIMLALPTTFVTVFGQNIGGPSPLFDPILTGVLVARFPIPSTNFAIVAMASTSLRIMFGLTFMNVNFLPIVP